MKTTAPDGAYTDLISGEKLPVENGTVQTTGRPYIFQVR
jgi:hypothetical protein